MRQVLPAAAVAMPPARRKLFWLVLPLAMLGLAVWWLSNGDLLRGFDNGAPPVEALTFERTILDSSGLSVLVRAGGSEPVTVAQVQVDDAYWEFRQELHEATGNTFEAVSDGERTLRFGQ